MPHRRDPMYRFLAVLTVASMVGLQGWRTLFNNFAVEVAGLEGVHVGVIQAVREIPGFLTFLVVYVLLVLSEHRLAALSIAVLGLGVAATGFLPTYGGLLLTTLGMSLGFHYYETANQSLTLQYFDRDTAPVVFGRLRALAAASNLAVGVAIFALAPVLAYRELYLAVGGLVVLAGAWGLTRNPTRADLPVQRKGMVLRRRYWLYYVLTFLAGARRQIFIAFSVFLLVKVFGFSVREITALFVLNNALNYLASPLIGKAIVRFGERRLLSVEYGGLVLIFLGYAFTGSRWVAAGLYVLDHLLFNFSIAIRTYFQKIGDPEDVAPTMAVGFAINHIAAVVLPAVGGLLWMIDHRVPFLGGAALSAVSLLFVQGIRTPARA
ncbi:MULTISPECIES: MFS transporter [Deferrisoma]